MLHMCYAVHCCSVLFGQLNLYRLLRLLHKEAQLVKLNVRLMLQGCVACVQRRAVTALRGELLMRN